jgi:hypothetical protein
VSFSGPHAVGKLLTPRQRPAHRRQHRQAGGASRPVFSGPHDLPGDRPLVVAEVLDKRNFLTVLQRGNLGNLTHVDEKIRLAAVAPNKPEATSFIPELDGAG